MIPIVCLLLDYLFSDCAAQGHQGLYLEVESLSSFSFPWRYFSSLCYILPWKQVFVIKVTLVLMLLKNCICMTIDFFSYSILLSCDMCAYIQWCSRCRADANEAAVILLPSNITVFTLDFSGSGLFDGDYVSLGWHEVSYLFMHVFIRLLISGY